MIEYRVFYDNGERIVISRHDVLTGRFKELLPSGRDIDLPDEVKEFGTPLIERKMTLQELSRKGFTKQYGSRVLLRAKDIPLSRAIPKEWK